MATKYSSAYEQLPQKPSVSTAKGVAVRTAEIGFRMWFRYAMNPGDTAADIIKLCSIFAAVPVAVPQIAGVRLAKFVLRSSGNVGGSVTFNLGTAATPTLLGSALTTLQSATTLVVTDAVCMAAGPFLTNDDFQMVLAAGPSTTLQTVDGYAELYMTAP